MALGVAFALMAGLVWGLVFVAPLLLPQYSAALLTCGRYLAFGLVALPLGWLDRVRLREFAPADWLEALKLSAVGNFLYYLCLAAAIQRAGGPLPTMVIGTLPVVIAISSNLHPAGFDELMPKTLATATVDRLLHHAHVCQTSGDSVRLTQALAGRGVTPLH